MAQQTARPRTYSGAVELFTDGEFVASMTATLWKKTGARTDWGGTLTPEGAPIVAIDPGDYTLRLPDGSEGRLIIARATVKAARGEISQVFEVQGNSEPPF